MWSSAATHRCYVENVIAQGYPDRVLAHNVSWSFPMISSSEKVLVGTAEVKQPTTIYVFMGQGSQEPGMGMDLYNNSPAARAVWDGANAHLLATGIQDQAIRQRYMDMTYNTLNKDGHVETLPLFADIDSRTPCYAFNCHNGLPFSDALYDVVDMIAAKTGSLLETINFNVEDQQYVYAGELVALQTMMNILNYLKVKKIDIAQLTKQYTDVG